MRERFAGTDFALLVGACEVRKRTIVLDANVLLDKTSVCFPKPDAA